MSVLDKLHRRLQLMVTRAVVRLIDPSTLMQELQVERLPGEVLDRVEHFEGYGLTAHAPAGAEAIVMGRRGRLVALSVAHRQYRLVGLAAGEVAIYDDLGQKVHLTRAGIVVVSPLVTIQADQTHITGALQVDGAATFGSTIAATGSITSAAEMADSVGTMSGMRTTYNGHTHNETSTVTAAPNQSM